MPSVAWYPLALLLFDLSEGAIFFVVVVGTAPSVTNGLINGVDNINPVILPAALPSFAGGLEQRWAFAWRSLLAGVQAVMLARFVIGVLVDALVFGTSERKIRKRCGLIDAAAT